MCSGERSSSAKGAIARRAASAREWPTSRRRVLSLWTISGPSDTSVLVGRRRADRVEGDEPDDGEDGEAGADAEDDPTPLGELGRLLRLRALLGERDDAEDERDDRDAT